MKNTTTVIRTYGKAEFDEAKIMLDRLRELAPRNRRKVTSEARAQALRDRIKARPKARKVNP